MSTPIKTKSTKRSSASTKTTEVEVPVETVAEPVVELVETPVAETTEVTFKDRITVLMQEEQELINYHKEATVACKRRLQELKKLERDIEGALKEAQKKQKKKKVPRDETKPRPASGILAPLVVSDELYEFLAQFDVKKGEPISRTQVTKFISKYIKDHDLQDPNARRTILPDATLKKIFKEADSYQYFTLQRVITHHFPKKQV